MHCNYLDLHERMRVTIKLLSTINCFSLQYLYSHYNFKSTSSPFKDYLFHFKLS